MSDQYTPIPVKTKNNGDIVAKLCDGTTNTQVLAISSAGAASTNNTYWGGATIGAAVAAGSSASGNVIAVQGVSGGTAIPISGSITTTFPFAGNADAQTASSSGQATGLMGYNGTTWDRLRVDSNKYLEVNVGTITLPMSGSSDAQTASTGQAVALVGYNGTTWDRLRVDSSKNLEVNINAVSGPGGSSGSPLYVSTVQPTHGTLKNSGQIKAATVASGSSGNMNSGLITSGKVGSLLHVVMGSSVGGRWDLQTINSSNVATTIVSLYTTGAVSTVEWRCVLPFELQTASGDASHVAFNVVFNNNDPSLTADAYSTFWWVEN